jgi:hypothetical protein
LFYHYAERYSLTAIGYRLTASFLFHKLRCNIVQV